MSLSSQKDITNDTSEVSEKKYALLFEPWGSFGDRVAHCDGGRIVLANAITGLAPPDDSETSSSRTGRSSDWNFDDVISEDPVNLAPWLSAEKPPPLVYSRNIIAGPSLFAVTPTIPVVHRLTGRRRGSHFISNQSGFFKDFCQQWDEMTETANVLHFQRISAEKDTRSKNGRLHFHGDWTELLNQLEDDSISVEERLEMFENFNVVKSTADVDRNKRLKKIFNNYDLLEKGEEFAPIDPLSFGGTLQTFRDPRSTSPTDCSLILALSGTNFDQYSVMLSSLDHHFVLNTHPLCEAEPFGTHIRQLAARTFMSFDPIIGARTSDGRLRFDSLDLVSNSCSINQICKFPSPKNEPCFFTHFDLSKFVPGEFLATSKNRELFHCNFVQDANRFIDKISLPDCNLGCCRSATARSNAYPFRVHFGEHPRQYVATEAHTMWLGDMREANKKPLLLFEPRTCSDLVTSGTHAFYEGVASDKYFGELFASELGPGPNCHIVSTETNLLLIDQRMPRRIAQWWGLLLQSPAAYLTVKPVPCKESAEWLALAGTQFSDEVLACPISLKKSSSEAPVAWGLPWRVGNLGSVDNYLQPGSLNPLMVRACLRESPMAGLAANCHQINGSDFVAVLQQSAQCHLFYQLYCTQEEGRDFDLGQGNHGAVTSPLDTMMTSFSALSALGKMCQRWADDVNEQEPEGEPSSHEPTYTSITSSSVPRDEKPATSDRRREGESPGDDDDDDEGEDEGEDEFSIKRRPEMPRLKFKLLDDEPAEDNIGHGEGPSWLDEDIQEASSVARPGRRTLCCNCKQSFASRHASRDSPELETILCSLCNVSLGDARQVTAADPVHNSRTFLMSTQSTEMEHAIERVTSFLPTTDDLDKFTDSFSTAQRLIWAWEGETETPFETDEYLAAMEARIPWAKRRIAEIVKKAFHKAKNPQQEEDSDDDISDDDDDNEAANIWSGETVDPVLLSKMVSSTFGNTSTSAAGDDDDDLAEFENQLEQRFDQEDEDDND